MSKLSPQAQDAILRQKATRAAKSEQTPPEQPSPSAAGVSREAGAQNAPEAPGDVVTLMIQYNGDPAELTALGFTIKRQFGDILTGYASVDQVDAIAQHPGIIQIDTPRGHKATLDNSIPDVKANQVWARSGTTFTGMTGKGVVVGIIDSGIDYRHKAFRDPAAPANSRILAIWDQTLGVPGNSKSPGRATDDGLGAAGLDYGKEFLRAEITSALANGNPYSVVEHRDLTGHGTHVAGTAAGNGAEPGGCCEGPFQYIGVAPEADIIVVRLFGFTRRQGNRRGDREIEPSPVPDGHTYMLDAIDYIITRARKGTAAKPDLNKDKPVVINLSLGRDIGPRNGSHPIEIGLDALVGDKKGVAIVLAAGNEADEKRHAKGTIAPSGSATFALDVKAGVTTRVELDVRYGGSALRAQIKSPESDATWQKWVPPGGSEVFQGINNGGTASVVNVSNNIYFSLSPAPHTDKKKPRPLNQAGKWQFKVENPTAAGISIDLYTDDNATATLYDSDADNNGLPAGFQFTAEATTTVNTSAEKVIVVGAYSVEGDTKNQLAGFSSHGPVFRTCPGDDPSCNVRPHLIAPGVAITSAAHDAERACCWCCSCCEDSFYVNKEGTSMATPHVTGAVALMLQKNKMRTYKELRSDLQNAAAGRRDNIAIPGVDPIPPASWPRNDLGWGKLDAKAAVDLTPVELPPAPPPGPAAPVTPGDLAIEEPVADATPAAVPVSPAGTPDLVAALRSRVLATDAGRRLNRLVQAHFREVRDLVNTNKRVAVTWHRNHGPAMIRLAMRLANAPAGPLPVFLEGEPLFDCADRIVEVVSRYASDALRRDALPYRHLLEHLRYGLSPEDWVRVIEQFEAPAPAVPVA